MENRKETMSFVLIGYQEKINDFIGRLKYSEVFKENNFTEQDQFEVTSNNLPPEEILEQFRSQFPVRIFNSRDKAILITYVIPENKIIIENKQFTSDKFDDFRQLCLNIVNPERVVNAVAIGMNFSVVYDLDYKLRLLNNQIDNLIGWDNNVGFSISIPLSIDTTITANYKIEKLKERVEDSKKIRTYKTFVNYNFDLSRSNSINISDLFYKCKTTLYEQFNKNQKAIIEIGQINND